MVTLMIFSINSIANAALITNKIVWSLQSKFLDEESLVAVLHHLCRVPETVKANFNGLKSFRKFVKTAAKKMVFCGEKFDILKVFPSFAGSSVKVFSVSVPESGDNSLPSLHPQLKV